jgi:hypothetical protein
MTLTPEAVAAVLAGIMSLAFTLIPGLNAKFAALSEDVKRAVQAGLSVLIAVVIYAVACTPSISAGFPFACPTGGAWGLLVTIFLAVTINQGVYAGTPRPSSLKAARKD